MKTLIYLIFFFGYVALQVYFMNVGITLGGIPTVILLGLTWWAAKTVYNAWAKKHGNQNETEESEEQTNENS